MRKILRFIQNFERKTLRQHPAYRRVMTFFKRLGSLRWWINRSWKFKVQFLIGVTAFWLLVFSLGAWGVYQHEFAKISDNFMRLQLFGPQHVFYSGKSESETISNPCVYHIETRRPFGNSIPGARVEATLSNEGGEPFWHHVDETGPDGCLDLRIPNIPMPNRVLLQIHAEKGHKTDDLTAFLTASPSAFTVPAEIEDSKIVQNSDLDAPPETNSDTENASDADSSFEFHDRPLTNGSFPILNSFSSNSEHPIVPNAEMTLPERLISGTQLPILLVVRKNLKRPQPLFVGVWKNNVLLSCRPFAAGKHARTIRLAIPETVFGPVSVLLMDCSTTPPRVLQHELAYRLPEPNEEKAAAQLAFLKSYAEKSGTPLFRASEQQMEFLPLELENPEEVGSPAEARQESARLLQTAQNLLGSAISGEIPTSHRFVIPELFPLRRLCGRLDQLTLALAADENDAPKEEILKSSEEDIRMFMSAALRIQSLYLNEKCSSNAAFQAYYSEMPIIYDGQVKLEKNFNSQLRDFRFNTRLRLGSFSCIILCSASCLVLMMLMMSILGLPSDWRVWILTFVVVISALGAAYVISNQSDVDAHKTNIRYIIFLGADAPASAEER